MRLSDHVNIKCSVRNASEEYPIIKDAPQITCPVPTPDTLINRVCPYTGCGQFCSSPSDLIVHIRIHTGERPFVCSNRCGYRSTSNGNLSRHLKICNGSITNRINNCPYCPASSPIKVQFDAHVVACLKRRDKFNPNANYTCRKCLFSTVQRSKWEDHELSQKHNDEHILIWHFCITCNYVSDHFTNYQNHMKSVLHKNLMDGDEDVPA